MSHEAREDVFATKDTKITKSPFFVAMVSFVARLWTAQASVTSMAADVSL